jgi:transketolase
MKARVLELSYRHGLSHIGSCLSTADVLAAIFPTDDLVLLSSGHAGLALYCAIEKYRDEPGAAESLLLRFGPQPHLSTKDGILCSTGSLGQGLTVAVGYALADRKRIIHCIISDGECAEGCVWESLAFIHAEKLRNLIVHVNVNGWSALSKLDTINLCERLRAFLPSIVIHKTSVEQYPFLKGLDAHYKPMTKADYESTLCEAVA